MSRTLLGLLGALFTSVLLLIAFQRLASATARPTQTIATEVASVSATSPAWDAIRTSTAEPARERWVGPFPAKFELDEATTRRVGTPIAGRVSQVFVGLGDEVRKGQPLFTVVSHEYAALRSEHEKLALEARTARDAHARTSAMVAAQALAAKESVESQRRLQLAETSLRQMDVRLRSVGAHASQAGFTVTAPSSGLVVQKDVLTSEHVACGGKHLLTIGSLTHVRVASQVFERDAVGMRVGTKMRVTSPSLPGFSTEARVEWIASIVDPERHTLTLWASVPNPEGLLRANMHAEVTLRRATLEGAVDVSASALVSTGSRQYVYVKEASGAFSQRNVQATAPNAGLVMLLRGVAAGESVVEVGVQLLENHALWLQTAGKGYPLSPCPTCAH